MTEVGSDSWLEKELAELEEAEDFIQQAMSGFAPSDDKKAKVDAGRKEKADVSTRQEKQVVKSASPKAPAEVDKLANHLIQDLEDTSRSKNSSNHDDFPLPPPPDLNDLIISQKSTTIADLPPPPPVYKTPVDQVKKEKSAMSKPAPPPVLPKPSRSTALSSKNKSVTIQVNPQQVNGRNNTYEPARDVAPKPVVKLPPPVQEIPKNIEKNSAEELDFLTKNLLSNMDNPSEQDLYGYCEKCNKTVEGEKVGCKALDSVYHITCFRCVTCSRPLHGEPFYAVEKNCYCETCYIASLDNCTVCSLKITDRILRATGKPYHPECFKCTVCSKSLDGISFTLDEEDNIYCVEDYHQKFAARCSVCHMPILPEPGKEETVKVIALDKDFHVSCYKCEQCQVPFSKDQGCFPLDNHIFCRDCNTIMVQQLSA